MLPAMTAPAPTKVRPSWWWFVLGGGLLVAAVASGIGLFVWTLGGFLATDATVPVDERPHVVEVGTDGDRIIWTDATDGRVSCVVVDRVSGGRVRDEYVDTDLRRDDGSGERVGRWRFDPGSGDLEVTCVSTPGAADVEIGPAPSLESFGLGILLTIGVPLLLGGLGVVVLLVTGILWSTRATTRR